MTYEQLEGIFFNLNTDASPSSFHGFLCGQLSCSDADSDELLAVLIQWLSLDAETADAAQDSLIRFSQSCLSDLQSDNFLFQPLLPDDELPLSERLLALGDWCSHYISGIGEGMRSKLDMNDEFKEVLEDIAGIGQISTDYSIEDDSERDYVELVEYIRVAVKLVFTDLCPERSTEVEQPTIH
jgi:hypothetical protein